MLGKRTTLVGLAMIGCLLAGAQWSRAATYTYSGNNFNSVSGAYTTSMRVTGTFVLGAPLAPGMPLTEIKPSVLSYSFSDGLQTLTEANSEIVVLLVATDSQGRLTEWLIAVWV